MSATPPQVVPTTYIAGQSTGVGFATGKTRHVVVTNEVLSESSGYEGDIIDYTATVKDNTGASLPATFIVDLEINSTKVITGQALSVDVYLPLTGILKLSWTVPAAEGIFTVKLVWSKQII